MILTSHLLYLALSASLSAAAASPQDAAAAEQAPLTSRVIPVRHAEPIGLARTLEELGTQVRVVPSRLELVLRGATEQVDELAALIAQLDKPGGETVDVRQEVISIQHAVAKDVAEVLGRVIYIPRPGPATLRIATDARNNAVIIAGTADDLKRSIELVRRLDVPVAAEPPRPASAFRLSFYFLAATFADGPRPAGAPLPPALKPVAEALAENGFAHASLISPAHVMADPSAGFEQSWPVAQDETTVLNFELAGQADECDEGDAVLLTLRAQVRGTVKDGGVFSNFTAFSLDTDVTTSLNEYVVLAASPSGANLGGAMILVLRVTRETR